MTRERTFWYAAICGYCINSDVTSLQHDILGQKYMLDRVQNHWVDSWITGPIAAVLLALMLLWGFLTWRDAQKADSNRKE